MELTDKKGSPVFPRRRKTELEQEVAQRTAELQRSGERLEKERLDHAQTIKALAESEKQYRMLAENFSDVVWTMDMDFKYTYLSPSIKPLRGYTAEEAITQGLKDVLTPASYDKALQVIQEELAKEGSAQADPFRSRTVELEHIHRDGHTVWAEVKSSFLRDEEGRPVGILGVSRDVTERKKAEKALAVSENRLRLLAENMSDVIWVLDRKGRHTYVSSSIMNLLGYTPQEILALEEPEFVAPSSLQLAKTSFRKAFLDKPAESGGSAGATAMELKYIHKDGSPVWVDVRWFAVRDDEGTPTGIMGVTRDISERKKLEEQLRQSQKLEAVGRLAGGIAHDFNNLMTALSNYSDLLLSDLDPGSSCYENVEEIRKVGERASALTRQLLAFGMKQEHQPARHDLNGIVKGMEDMLRRLIGEDVIQSTSIQSGPVMILVDRGQVEQVLVNLALNARDAMPKGGTLTIETSRGYREGGRGEKRKGPTFASPVVLTVRDSGMGMDAHTISQIFDPFFTTKEPGKGTGLGLSTVYGIVKQSQGDIEVQSKPGRGTSFRVSFPVAGEEPVTEESPPASVVDSATGSETILLVEDEDLVRHPLRFVLNKKGYHVLEAEDGEAALRICENHKESIHLMITDIVMPRMNGLDLARQARKVRPDMKVLYVSGYHRLSESMSQELAVGKNFLFKPFSPLEILQKVRHILSAAPENP